MRFHAAEASLRKYANNYFHYHIAARVSAHPCPVNEHEVKFIYDNLQKVAPIEYFRFSKGSMGNPYGTQLKVIFSSGVTHLNPYDDINKVFLPEEFVSVPSTDSQYTEVLQFQQSQICNKLHSICAIPRHSYIQNLAGYLKGAEALPYKYQLIRNQSQFNNFSVSDSSVEQPFCIISAGEKKIDPKTCETFKESIRHNFEKFHKLQFAIDVGSDAVRQLTI
ncbi:hypothetical protein PGUG_05445 [Meyerozyma guilliermondii ATCC 6260]|uniref:Uncharacterized protein n=1 Tax=Meyerozyma guilliermondii (strain ATCC 6260 / CBS 566 / DSM 6381 / JCM 1539 / NBRC 10279 / NRRL Y-324) TaxID=294746 RepID=A5DQ94_PICGU|nr:uncharacterized protein PGUG_05445 [Meyerozyma guilliermondii ATCC 6260]EDK41347.2 hypothetical protein PGUG_05445 [Meyerozyma guilliermondii ATCC 6260]